MERYENTETYAFVTDLVDDFEDLAGRAADREEAHALETIWNMEPDDLSVVYWLINIVNEERGGQHLLERRIDRT